MEHARRKSRSGDCLGEEENQLEEGRTEGEAGGEAHELE